MEYSQKQDKQLLSELYRSTQMGAESIRALISEASDPALKTELSDQLCGYQKLSKRAHDMLEKRGGKAEETSKMKSLGIHTGIKLNTLIDKTSSHLAEMAIEGSNMGIVGTTKQLSQFSGASQNVRQLGNEFVSFEQHNIEALKRYL
ncbi:MAG TPA: hypothetical protein H9662_00175 [Firmicutes bacterium]|nr:hypothetical protein [Bacillota bacterium]